MVNTVMTMNNKIRIGAKIIIKRSWGAILSKLKLRRLIYKHAPDNSETKARVLGFPHLYNYYLQLALAVAQSPGNEYSRIHGI